MANINNGTLEIECEICKTHMFFDSADCDFEYEGGTERGMGDENSYKLEIIIECDGCKKEISIEYNVYEYPIGAYNNHTIKIEGANLIQEFDFEFNNYEDL